MAGSQAIGCATSPDRRTGGASLPLWTRARCLHSAMMQAWIIGDLRAMVIIAYAVVIFAIITLFKGVRIVPQGFEWTVERFGRYDRTLMPGLGLTVPWVEAVGRKLNMMRSEEHTSELQSIMRISYAVFCL